MCQKMKGRLYVSEDERGLYVSKDERGVIVSEVSCFIALKCGL